MRPLALALLAALALSGCGEAPVDPYQNMPMMNPAELGAASVDVDPVDAAEKVHNAEFARAPKGR